MLKVKKKNQLYKKIKKITIEEIKIKIKIKNKFYFRLKGEIEKEIQFIKRMKTKLKTYQSLSLIWIKIARN